MDLKEHNYLWHSQDDIKKIMVIEDYVLKLLIEHNYRLLKNGD